MQATYVQRLRLTFRKIGPTRYISHLDLAHTLERALNRAQMPVTYSQGFNRRPRLSMATALPLGYTSECELADIWLDERVEPDAALTQMMSRMAPGIEIVRVEDVPTNGPSLQSITTESTYVATLLDEVDTGELRAKIAALLAADSIGRVRERGKESRNKKRKEYDLRPLVLDLQLMEVDDKTSLVMRLCLEPSNTGRPDEVLLELGLDPLAARIHRTQLVLSE